MKYSEIEFAEGVSALIKSINDDKIHTIAHLNEEGGECTCCQVFSKEYLDDDGEFKNNVEVLKVVNIKTMQVIYDSGVKNEG